MTVENVLQRIGRRCLAHLLRNEPAALADQPEGIHQMRVAIRRLRSAREQIVSHKNQTFAHSGASQGSKSFLVEGTATTS